MKRATEKLHSRRGASVILALLLMLVATLVSAVILSAAVTAAHRVDDDVALQEDSLAINSAGKAIVAYLKHEPVFSYTWTDWEDTNDSEPLPKNAANITSSSAVMQYLAEMAEEMGTNNTLSDQKLSAYFTAADVSIQGANMTYSVERAGNVYFIMGTIYLGGDPASSPQKLYLSAQMMKNSQPGSTVYKDGDPIDGTDPQEYEQIPGTPYTVSWTMDDGIYLVSRKELITR